MMNNKDIHPQDITIEEMYLLYEYELYDLVLDIVKDKFEVYTGIKDMYIACFPKESAEPYPVLCSHLDIKFCVPPKEVKTAAVDGREVYKGYTDYLDKLEPYLLGGDDRNGVWAMLELIKQGFTDFGYVFAKQEEEGRRGAIALTRDRVLQIKRDEIAYFLMLDNDGRTGLGFRKLEQEPGLSSLHQNKEFIKKLESFAGYELHEDGVSDYIEYCKATGLCGINFSVGFENEHTVDEFTDIQYLEELPSRILDFIKHLGNAQYALEYECSEEELLWRKRRESRKYEIERPFYQTLSRFPYSSFPVGGVKGQYIEIFHGDQKITGVIMQRDSQSVIVDITSPYWNASKGMIASTMFKNEYQFDESTQVLIAKDLLLKLYVDCKHAYDRADPAFWENEEYSKFYLREYVPYERLSREERFFGPQIREEDFALYLESRRHILWPSTSGSYIRARIKYMKELKEKDEREFPDSRFLGNLVEITHEGQRVQGEIIRRDCNQISVQIRYPYDGLIERRTNKFIIYDPSQSHFSNFDYEGGELMAKRLLKLIYERASVMEKHLDNILAAYEEYERLIELEKSQDERKAASEELEKIQLKLRQLRNDLHEGKIKKEDYHKARAPYKRKVRELHKIAHVRRGPIYEKAFAELLRIPQFKEPHKHTFDVGKNPEIITGNYKLEAEPDWFVPNNEDYKY